MRQLMQQLVVQVGGIGQAVGTSHADYLAADVAAAATAAERTADTSAAVVMAWIHLTEIHSGGNDQQGLACDLDAHDHPCLTLLSWADQTSHHLCCDEPDQSHLHVPRPVFADLVSHPHALHGRMGSHGTHVCPHLVVQASHHLVHG